VQGAVEVNGLNIPIIDIRGASENPAQTAHFVTTSLGIAA
jgi:hypothetical protein